LRSLSKVVVAGTPPKVTVAPPTKLVPLMVTAVLPASGPEVGEIDVMIGETPEPPSGVGVGGGHAVSNTTEDRTSAREFTPTF
jgi:hypothetical protein